MNAVLIYTGWANPPPPHLYILLFIVLLYLFTFTNNIPCELKLYPRDTEAQIKLVVSTSTGCSKNYSRVKAPQHHYITMAKHNSNAWLCLYPSNSCILQPDSQVNNCSMCPPWTWTTAFNHGRHWSTALLMSCWSRLAQQVHILSLRSSKPTTHRTEVRDIPVNFSISLGLLLYPGLSSSLHISSAKPSIFCSIQTVLRRPLYRPSERSSSLCQSCGDDL